MRWDGDAALSKNGSTVITADGFSTFLIDKIQLQQQIGNPAEQNDVQA